MFLCDIRTGARALEPVWQRQPPVPDASFLCGKTTPPSKH